MKAASNCWNRRGPDSPIEKFMAKRGEGIHHIAVRVDNIEEALERFKAPAPG